VTGSLEAAAVAAAATRAANLKAAKVKAAAEAEVVAQMRLDHLNKQKGESDSDHDELTPELRSLIARAMHAEALAKDTSSVNNCHHKKTHRTPVHSICAPYKSRKP
jgi:hypothetical protein